MRRFYGFLLAAVLSLCLCLGFSYRVKADTVSLTPVSFLETVAAVSNSFITENGSVPSSAYAVEFLSRLDYMYCLYYDRSSSSPSVGHIYNAASPGTDDYYGLFLNSGTLEISEDNVGGFLYALNNQIKIPFDVSHFSADVSPTVLSSRQYVYIGYTNRNSNGPYGMFFYGYPIRDFTSVYAVSSRPSSYSAPGYTYTAVNSVVGSAIVAMDLDASSFVAVVGCGRQDVAGFAPVVFTAEGSTYPTSRFEQVLSWNGWAVQPVSDLSSSEAVSVNKINTSTGAVTSVSNVATQYQFYANTQANAYSYQYGSIILSPAVPYRLHHGSTAIDGQFWGSDVLSGTASSWSEWADFTSLINGTYSAISEETMTAILANSALIDSAAGVNTSDNGSGGAGGSSVDLTETNNLLQGLQDTLNQGDPDMGSELSEAVSSAAAEEFDLLENAAIDEAFNQLDTSYLEELGSFAYIKQALESFYTSLGPVRDVVTFSLTLGAVALLLGL